MSSLGHMNKCQGLIPLLFSMKKTYPGAKLVRQKLRQVHPRKATTIKEEVEKLLKDGFIYPIPLTEWVSNIVPAKKKQGTIRAYINFRDLNRAFPKHNFPTPYID